MSDFFDLIKKQISRQTEKPINTDLKEVSVSATKKSVDKPSIESTVQINPEWVMGSYVLQRVSDNTGTFGLSVDDFLNYSGKIDWKTISGRVTDTGYLNAYTNTLLGIQLFSTHSTALMLPVQASFGSFRVYLKDENNTSFNLVYKNDSSDKIDTNIRIQLSPNNWNTIVILFYNTELVRGITFGGDYTDVSKYRLLDVSNPTPPTWGSTPIDRETVNNNSSKINLYWVRDNDIGFAGNGIYRSGSVSADTVLRGVPNGTLLTSIYDSTEDSGKWFLCDSNATLRVGLLVGDYYDYFGTIEHIISSVQNKNPNPVFSGSTYSYATVSGTIKQDKSSVIGLNYYEFSNTQAGERYHITSTMIPVSQASLYNLSLISNSNLFLRRAYDVDGYGSEPSRWNISGSITSAIATKINDTVCMEVLRYGKGVVYTDDQSFYLSTVASYSVSSFASFSRHDSYKISFHTDTNATVYCSPSLFTGHGFDGESFLFTPSIAGTCYMKINISATTPTTNFGTMHFAQFGIRPKYKSYLSEYLKVSFYESNKSSCATVDYTTELVPSTGLSIHNVILGSFSGSSVVYGDQKLPVTCSYIKLSYVATINSTATYCNVYRKILGIYVTEKEDQILLGAWATAYDLVKVSQVHYATYWNNRVGNSIYFQEFEHIVDRPRQLGDSNVITWSDYNVNNDTFYSYKIDSYDNSPFKNRSDFSSTVTIFSGDTVSPKRPTSYTLVARNGGIGHYWVNPTASDLSKINCYSDAKLTRLLFSVSAINEPKLSLTDWDETIAHWKFNGTLSCSIDDSNNLTGHNIGYDNYCVGYQSNSKSAVYLNNTVGTVSGSTSYADLSYDSTFEMGSGNFSLEFVARSRKNSGNIAGMYDTTNLYGWYAKIANDQLSLVLGNGSEDSYSSGSSVADGLWHYYAITVDRSSNEANFYIDGVPSSSSPVDISSTVGDIDSPSYPAVFKVGAIGPYYAFDGMVDEIVVHKGKVLSEDEVLSSFGNQQFYSETVTATGDHSRYLAAMDAYGNMSYGTLATCYVTEEFPDHGPSQFQTYMTDLSNNDVVPNANGWYNQDVRLHVDMPGNNIIATYWVRYKIYPGAWSAWVDITTNKYIQFVNNYKYMIQFKSKDIYGTEFYSNEQIVLVDDRGPLWAGGKSYELWTSTTKAQAGYNLLDWDSNQSSVSPAATQSIQIYRAQTTAINKGYSFNLGVPDGAISSWSQTQVANATIKLHSGASFIGDNSFKYQLLATPNISTIENELFSVLSGDTVHAHIRVAGSLADVGTLFFGIKTSSTSSICSSIQILDSFNSDSEWKYYEVSFTSGEDRDLLLYLDQETSQGDIGDYILLDEAVAVKNMSPELLVELDKGATTYADTNVDPWAGYMYSMKIVDNADNIGDESCYKYIQAVADYRDSHPNLVNNSSFERVYKTGAGTLQADSWVSYYYTGQFTTSGSDKYYDLTTGSGYHGDSCAQTGNSVTGTRVCQHGIQILPYNGRSRKFVYSAYVKSTGDDYGYGYMFLYGYGSNRDTKSAWQSTKYFSVTSASGWKRVTGSLVVTSPSINNFTIFFTGGKVAAAGTPCFIDAVQVEEKDAEPARDYADSRVMTADYMQAAYIRSYMLEADSVIADHIQSNSITTNELKLVNSVIHLKDGSKTRLNTVNSATIGSGSYTSCTLPYFGESVFAYSYVVVDKCASGSYLLRVGSCDANFRSIGSNDACSTLNSTGNILDSRRVGLISSTWPNETKAVSIVFSNSQVGAGHGGTLWYSFTEGLAYSSDWSSPVIVATQAYVPYSDFRCYGTRFYFAGSFGGCYATIRVTKIAKDGTVLQTKDFAFGTNITHTTFDFTNSGTMLLMYTFDGVGLDGARTKAVALSTTFSQLAPTFDINMYNGGNVSNFGFFDEVNRLSGLSCAYSTLGRFVTAFSYKGGFSDTTFYKVLSATGSIYVGDGSDLRLYTVEDPTEPKSDANLDHVRCVNSLGSSVFVYTPFEPLKDLYGYSYGGYGLYLTSCSPTVNLNELLNRLT